MLVGCFCLLFHGRFLLLLFWLVVVGVVGGCCWWSDNGAVLLVLITSKTGEIFVVNDPFDKRLKMGLI